MIEQALERRKKKLILADKNLWESSEVDRYMLKICDGVYCWRAPSVVNNVALILCEKGSFATVSAEADVDAGTCVVTFSICGKRIVKTIRPYDVDYWCMFETAEVRREILGPTRADAALEIFMDWIVEQLAKLGIVK